MARRSNRFTREERRQASQERLHAKARGREELIRMNEEYRRQREFAMREMRKEGR